MRTILIFLEKYFLFIPRAGSIWIDDLLYTMKRSSLREKEALEQRKIIDLIKTLDGTNEEVRMALDKAEEGNYEEVIKFLVFYINKYTK